MLNVYEAKFQGIERSGRAIVVAKNELQARDIIAERLEVNVLLKGAAIAIYRVDAETAGIVSYDEGN